MTNRFQNGTNTRLIANMELRKEAQSSSLSEYLLKTGIGAIAVVNAQLVPILPSTLRHFLLKQVDESPCYPGSHGKGSPYHHALQDAGFHCTYSWSITSGSSHSSGRTVTRLPGLDIV
jgi:hypothetical protein